jgi:predicted ATPase/DNA-binding SARP family transcriptional activator
MAHFIARDILPNMANQFSLKFFGTFELYVDGHPVKFKRRKSELLVAYLALHLGPQMREKLASLFWGDTSDEDARRALRVTLTDARQTLGEDALPGDRDSLSLRPDIYEQVDVNQFQALLQPDPGSAPTSNLLAALELYRGDLLAGYYDDWLIPLRDACRAAVFSSLRALAERARAAGHYEQTARYARHMLEMEPLNESGLQHLLFALSASGEKEKALEALKLFEAQGGSELSPETLTLIRQIRAQGSGPARLSNLPRPMTSFIGREDELNAIQTLLARHRLITLLGPGGSGKTRLAIQTGDEVAHDYPGGVWWVDFSALTESALVPQVIAKTLGAREQAGVSFLQSAAALIGDKKTLLLLDNCEHVLAACAQSVGVLLIDCPNLSILATSREPLDLSGETGWPVPALPLPGAALSLKALARNEATRLFVERGRSANPSFELTEANAAHVVQICRRLDGIPLALELAATLLRAIPVADVDARLSRQFEALHLNDDQRPPRQQTLHALIDWSYNLLTPAEQIFFRRLGVFAGGWSFESAMSVAGGYASESLLPAASGSGPLLPLPISATDIVYGLLDALKRRSLISITHTEGLTRYQMLETLREYALERCAEHHELEALRARHIQEMLRQAERMEEQLASGLANQVNVLRGFDPEVDNVRSGLGWALRGGDLQNGMRLCAAVYRYWSIRQMYVEIRDWLEQFCAHPQTQHPTSARGYALARYALSLRNDPQRRFTPQLTHEAADIFTALGDEEGLAHARFAEGETLLNYGDTQQAEPPLLQALTYFRAHPQNVQTLSAILASLARIQLGRRHFEQAYSYVHESLAISESSHADLATGWNLLLLGDIAFHLDDLTLAERHYQRSLELYLPLKRLGNIAYLQEALAAVAFAQGDLPVALQRVEASLAAYDGYDGHSTFSRTYRAAIAQAQGDLETARAWLMRVIENPLHVELEYQSMYLLRLAEYAAARALPAEAASLFALTLRLQSDPHIVLFPPEMRAARAGLEALRATLPADAYDAAIECAQTLKFQEAVALVL